MATDDSPSGRFLPADAVALSLGITTDEVVSLVDAGCLRGAELGLPPRWRIEESSVQEYLDERSEDARRGALWRQSHVASFPELWGRGDVRHGD